MIHRQNWLDVRSYLHYMDRIRQNDSATIKRARSFYRHLLEWADETPLPKARSIDPTLPAYLLTARADGKSKPLAPVSMVKGLAFIRQYFSFARREWSLRYKPISDSWIESLQAPRDIRSAAQPPIREIYSLEDALKIAGVATETLREDRGRVAVCMLFLSGMRADALASMPISCVDVAQRALQQYPLMGVRTKNRKAAITYLLEIPELLAVVEAWDAKVRSCHPSNALWYSTLSMDGMTLTPTLQAYEGRHDILNKDIRLICDRAGVPYLSPHKLRHGHIVHALKNARDMQDLKAISQNVMHSSTAITDGKYGNLVRDDVRSTIFRLGKQKEADTAQLLRLIDMLKAQLT